MFGLCLVFFWIDMVWWNLGLNILLCGLIFFKLNFVIVLMKVLCVSFIFFSRGLIVLILLLVVWIVCLRLLIIGSSFLVKWFSVNLCVLFIFCLLWWCMFLIFVWVCSMLFCCFFMCFLFISSVVFNWVIFVFFLLILLVVWF